jgi:hypothetical protein
MFEQRQGLGRAALPAEWRLLELQCNTWELALCQEE